MGEPWLLAVDLGTTDLKVGAVSLRGELLAQTHRPIHTRYLPGGGAEQDPDEWWEQISSAVCSVVGSGALSAEDVAGVGITGQLGSTVPVDASGEPAGPCILWQDTRGAAFSARVLGGPVAVLGYSPANIVRWLQINGGLPSTRGADPLNHELYLRHHKPDVFGKTRYLMEPVDYVGLRFTGRPAATPASMLASWLTDSRPGAESGYVPELIRRAGRDADRLPELLPTASVLGPMDAGVARQLGLRQVPVVAGVPDYHAALLGSGAVEPFEVHIVAGTTCWISCEVPFKKTDVFHQMASVPGVRPNRYLVVNNQETAGLCLDWVRSSLVELDYEALNRLAATAPAGAGGVIFTPWLTGERTPVEDRTLRAGFLNLSVGSTKASLVRSVMEGVAFNARWLFDALEGFAGRGIPELRIQGGCAQSDLWCQIFADVFDRPILRVAEPRFHSLRGAALFAAVGLGMLTIDEVPQLVRVSDVFEPSTESRRTYQRMYAEFKGLYSSLHRMYARLNR